MSLSFFPSLLDGSGRRVSGAFASLVFLFAAMVCVLGSGNGSS